MTAAEVSTRRRQRVAMTAFAVAVPALVRIDLPRLLPALDPRRPDRAAADPRLVPGIRDCVDQAMRAGRRFVRRDCMTRGLTLWYFLRRAGFDAALVFGVGDVGGRMEGHCWIERDSEPLGEKRDPKTHFTETWRYPADNAGRPRR